jgi:hypothetical protein
MGTTASEIIEKFHSSELETQLSGMDDAKALIEEMVNAAVEVLSSSSNRYAIAEKLFSMGPVVVPELDKLLQARVEPEAMTYAGLILLRLGSPLGVARLIEALHAGVGPTGMIAENLAATGATGASEAITDALMRWPISKDPYTAVTLISALRKLNARVPDEILQTLSVAAPDISKLL